MKSRTRFGGPLVLAGVLFASVSTIRGADGAKAAGTPAASVPKSAALPPRMVSFFVGRQQCPDGWELETAAQGRMIVGVTKGGDVGVTVGTPMVPRTPPSHAHDFQISIKLTPKQIAAANGGSNRDGAAVGSYSNAGTIGPSTGDVPYYEFLVCRVPLGGTQ